MRAKLGIFNAEEADEKLIEDLLNMKQNHSADYKNTFSALTLDKLEETALFTSEEFKLWNELLQARLRRQQESKDDSQQLMRNSNPSVIPRNHQVKKHLKRLWNAEIIV